MPSYRHLFARWEARLEDFKELAITPRRADIEVSLFALAWVPSWYVVYKTGNITQSAVVPAT